MELLKMTSKRPLDDSNDFRREEFRKHRNMVPAVRDWPPGCGPCGISEAERQPLKMLTKAHSDLNEAERKPLKMLTKAHSDLGKIDFDEDDKLVDSNRVEIDKSSSCKPIELGSNRPSAVSRPSGKVKLWDPTCMKAGYDQKPKVTTTYGPQRKMTPVIKDLDNVDSGVRKTTPGGNDKLVSSCPVENSKPKSFVPKELGRSKSYLDSRSRSRIKYWDPTCEAQKSEDTTAIVSPKEHTQREKIKEAMAIFDQVYEQVLQENRLKPHGEKKAPLSLPMEAAKRVKQKLKWMDPEKTVGPVCGVQIGDKFKYRSQLMMVGLHKQPQAGIDYAKIEGIKLAISIVDAHRYSNESGSSDTLVYSGEGGLTLFGRKLPPKDQKLEKGNSALKNSKDKKSPVRVIRKVEAVGKDVFVYDGLYIVDHYTEGKSAEGKVVFKFHLKRVPGQPSIHNVQKW